MKKWERLESLRGMGGKRSYASLGRKEKIEGYYLGGVYICEIFCRITHPRLATTKLLCHHQSYLVQSAISQGEIHQVSAQG